MKPIFTYLLCTSIVFAGASLPISPVTAQTESRNDSASLQNALRRIARNSNDSSALADAGLAALRMGDTRAALGFLAKADQIYSKSGRVKAGLARALLQEQNPFGALRYFDEAVANGFPVRDIAADRGLAFDLIGRNSDAQKDYELALRHSKSDELLSRYAISLGISGDLVGADSQLYPLLNKSDRAAWRTKAFILAMNGQDKDANKIARQTMQKRMAKAIKPFFDRMPKLTAAQKAAAVHFGHFPASEKIGVDVASVRYASNTRIRGGDGADAGLIPLGRPLGEEIKKPKVLAMPDTSQRRRPGSRRSGSSPSAPKFEVLEDQKSLPSPIADVAAKVSDNRSKEPTDIPTAKPNKPSTGVLSKNATPGFATKLGVPASKDKPKTLAVASPPPTKPLSGQPDLISASVNRKVAIGGIAPQSNNPSNTPSGKQPTQLINFDLAKANSAPPAQTQSAPLGQKKQLSDIMDSIKIPDTETKPAVVPVDLNTIVPAKPKPKVVKQPEPKIVEPKHPKRYWVQIATGSNLDALKYDYRRMAKKQAKLFSGKAGWTSRWGRTRRLVVGPFENLNSAKKFESGFRKGGGDGFSWTSAKGTVVNKLNGK